MCLPASRLCCLIAVAFSLGCLISGILLVVFKNGILDQVIRQALPLVPGGPAYPFWKDIPIPIVSSFHFFNVTNAQDVQLKGAVPILQEVGPYVYNEFHKKVKIVHNKNNDTMTYQQVRTFHFDPEATGVKWSLDDKITTLNAPAATVNAMAMKEAKFTKGLIDIALKTIGEKLFVTKTIRELMFEGYEDPILTDTKWLPASIVPQKIDRFGYYYQRNGSDWVDGVFNMATGLTNLTELGEVKRWNYTAKTSFYPGHCAQVEGAGEFFPPESLVEPLKLWSNDLCRSMVLHPVEEDEYKKITGKWHKVQKSYWQNKTENPDNWCYNPNVEMPSGVFDASPCRFGAPVFISSPHFYMADPWYTKQVEGMTPDPEEHETSFLIEPSSGMALRVRARFQVNFLIEPISNIKLFSKIPKTVFPTMWTESKMDLPAFLTTELYYLSHVTNIVTIIGLVFVGISISYASVLLVQLLTRVKNGDGMAEILGSGWLGQGAVPSDRSRSESNAPILNESLLNEQQETN